MAIEIQISQSNQAKYIINCARKHTVLTGKPLDNCSVIDPGHFGFRCMSSLKLHVLAYVLHVCQLCSQYIVHFRGLVFTIAENVQNMKPVQFCTGFIISTFPATVTVRENLHVHYIYFIL